MRYFALFLLLLGCVGFTKIEAQNEEVIISYRTSYVSESLPSIAETFMREIETQLADIGVEIKLEQVSYPTDEVDTSRVSFSFFEVFDGERVIIDTGISIIANDGVLEGISPILENEVQIITQLSNEDSYTFGVAMILYATGHNEEALDVLSNITLIVTIASETLEFDNTGLHHLLGNIHLVLGNYNEATSYLESDETTWYRYGRFDSLVNLAWVYEISGNNAQGINIISTVIQEALLPSEWQPLVYLLNKRAQLYALTFDYDSAITDMDNAIDLAEENDIDNTSLAELYTIRGKIIFLIYEWDRVLENFNTAIELDPNYAPAYFERGVLFYTMSLREEALADFQAYLELEPEGLYAEQAHSYIESIQIELEALGG